MTPQPKSIKIVCTECGMDWEAHTQGKAKSYKPTAEDCVRVLKAEVLRLSQYPRQFATGTTSYIYPQFKQIGGEGKMS